MVFYVMHCHFHLKIMHLASVWCQLKHHQPTIKNKKKIGRKKEKKKDMKFYIGCISMVDCWQTNGISFMMMTFFHLLRQSRTFDVKQILLKIEKNQKKWLISVLNETTLTFLWRKKNLTIKQWFDNVFSENDRISLLTN